MRVLTFTKQDEEKFILLYSALNGSEKKLDIGGFRTLVKVLDKMEAISKEGETPQHPRTPIIEATDIGDGAAILKLEDTEYELVKGMVAETAWTVRVARLVVGVTDMLDNAPKE